jgi:malate permease and related proteins
MPRMFVIDTLAPVFLIIALGAILRRTGFLSDEVCRGANRLAYWIGLPCLLFVEIAESPLLGPAAVDTFLIAFVGTVAAIVLGYLAARAMRMPGEKVGTFVQSGFRGNLAYIALPVVLYAFSFPDGGETGKQARQLAALALGPLIPIYNVVAVIVLLASQHRLGRAAALRMARQIATNPLLLSCVAGLAWTYWKLPLPSVIHRTCDVMGQFALPTALITVGSTMARTRLVGGLLYPMISSLIKVAAAPAVGYVAALAMGAGPRETVVALILLACPSAVVSYVMVEQIGGDEGQAALGIVISTLLSIVSLGVVVAMIPR